MLTVPMGYLFYIWLENATKLRNIVSVVSYPFFKVFETALDDLEKVVLIDSNWYGHQKRMFEIIINRPITVRLALVAPYIFTYL